MRGILTGNELENINTIKGFCLGVNLGDKDARDVLIRLCGDTVDDLEALEAYEALELLLGI